MSTLRTTASGSTESYRPTHRRPIANLFRRTAAAAVRLCLRWGIGADAVSYASLVAAAGAAFCFVAARAYPILLLAAVAFGMLRLWLNMLDGMVALAAGTASRRGELLNDLPDRASDVLIFVAAAHSGYGQVVGGYGAALGALLVAYVGTFGQALGVGRQYGGVMSKPWRMAVLGAGALATLAWGVGAEPPLVALRPLDLAHLVIVLGCVQSIVVRLRRILRALSDA